MKSNFYSKYRYVRIFTQSTQICFRHIWTLNIEHVQQIAANGLMLFSNESDVTAIFQIILFPILVLVFVYCLLCTIKIN